MSRKIKRKKKEQILTGILSGILLILILIFFGIIPYLKNPDRALRQEGMGELIQDSEENALEDSPSASSRPSEDGKEEPPSDDTRPDTSGSGQQTDDRLNNTDSLPSDGRPSEEESESSSGGGTPSGNTDRHPYELPLIPVRNS